MTWSLLSAAAAYYAADRLASYDPCRQVAPFHLSNHLRRLVRAPNRVSKTRGAAVEAWAHATGRHPANPHFSRPPSDGWVLVADLQNNYSVLCEEMHATEPGPELHPDTKYVKGKGYYTNGKRMIRLQNGCTIEFRGGGGEVTALASANVGWLWIDEPPKPGHFGEALARVVVSNGPCWMTLTPIGRPVDWLRLHVEGDPSKGIEPAEDWEQHVYELSVEACTTVAGVQIRSEESIAAQRASCPPGQEGQRLRGEWEGVTEGRAIPAFIEAQHTLDRAGIAAALNPLVDQMELRWSWDHGEGTGNQLGYLVACAGRSCWWLDELIHPQNSTPNEIVAAVTACLQSWGLTPDHISRWFGDVNTAGLVARSAGLRSYNEFLEVAFGEAGYNVTIETPNKAPGSVLLGQTAINTALKEGRAWVGDGCVALIKALNHYSVHDRSEANRQLKNALDAARYGVQDRIGIVGGGGGGGYEIVV